MDTSIARAFVLIVNFLIDALMNSEARVRELEDELERAYSTDR